MCQTLMETGQYCQLPSQGRRCGLHNKQYRALHTLYHAAETQWRAACRIDGHGLHLPKWKKEGPRFTEAHRLLTISYVARTLHTNLFFPGMPVDEGHQKATRTIWQQRQMYETIAQDNGSIPIRATSDDEMYSLVRRLLDAITEATAPTITMPPTDTLVLTSGSRGVAGLTTPNGYDPIYGWNYQGAPPYTTSHHIGYGNGVGMMAPILYGNQWYWWPN